MDQQSPQRGRDPLFGLILIGIVVVVIWLMLMPCFPGLAAVTLRRFQLRTDSFPLWAIQAPVPSMYNFGNRYEVRKIPEGLLEPILPPPPPRYINHFPTRAMTFAFGRYVHLHDGSDRWITFWSSYRGQTLETKVHLKPVGEGRFEWLVEGRE
ncbi:hypothetical protein NHH03_24585 [Stieleria sp. TO1_6]|uniref:hypothetical protein n=1 Tax=Stieleria tagensis TaxID=2956795 RepID=UPI00209AAB69|nr:hypothetical protein [Stieleria tagensis]MCO8124938.1 hypothetical protein [Stieleria tagensis]